MDNGLHFLSPLMRRARDDDRLPPPSWRATPDLVSDWGDDHEMAEEFGNSLARASDRLAGFVSGALILGLIWVAWLLI
jgi:hypothetical protein